jgi:hypothetical protein
MVAFKFAISSKLGHRFNQKQAITVIISILLTKLIETLIMSTTLSLFDIWNNLQVV